ncbi:MAG: hypothetical protein Q8R28_15465 [Dehalococcoidia bacterium]|nr:hypothetical protein [Dehalococcoidia bacterium]
MTHIDELCCEACALYATVRDVPDGVAAGNLYELVHVADGGHIVVRRKDNTIVSEC